MEEMGNSPPQLRRRRRNQHLPQEEAVGQEEEAVGRVENAERPDAPSSGNGVENERRNHVTYHAIVDRGSNQIVIHQEETPIPEGSDEEDLESFSEMMAIRIFSRLLGATRMRRYEK